jgi:hypothetical protein
MLLASFRDLRPFCGRGSIFSTMQAPDMLRRLSGLASAKPNGAVNLMAREGRVRDIPQWQALHLSFGLPYTEESRLILPDLWRTLISSGRLLLFLVEDRCRPVGARVVSCCAAMFATDAFCEEARSRLPPFLGIQLARLYRDHQSPVLDPAQVARANAEEGLNLVVCFEGYDRGSLSHEQFAAVREKQREAFHHALRGFHLKEFLANPIGEEPYQELIDAGARLRRDYREYGTATGQELLPRLVGLTKEEAEKHPGSHLASLFVYTPPRFHFARAEQRLLEHALMGETCEDLATSLSLSVWTVKKRWQAIYGRVEDVDSELLPPSNGNGSRPGARGAERRRQLLGYLRQHPEELRPWLSRLGANRLLSLGLAVSTFLSNG